MVKALVHTEELLSTVDVLTEVHIVALIDVTLVHVATEQLLGDVLWRTDPKQVEHAQELVLGHVAVAGDVVVLEDGLQVDALVLDSRLVLLEDRINFLLILVAGQVFPARK